MYVIFFTKFYFIVLHDVTGPKLNMYVDLKMKIGLNSIKNQYVIVGICVCILGRPLVISVKSSFNSERRRFGLIFALSLVMPDLHINTVLCQKHC